MWLLQGYITNFRDFQEFIQKINAASVFIIFLIGMIRRWWVMGAEYNEMKEQRDYWRTMYREVVGGYHPTIVTEGVKGADKPKGN